MSIFWEEDDPSSFSAQIRAEAGGRYFLRVERLPDRGWDWVVWPAGGPRSRVRYGCAASVKTAKAAAEATLATLFPGAYACLGESHCADLRGGGNNAPGPHAPSW